MLMITSQLMVGVYHSLLLQSPPQSPHIWGSLWMENSQTAFWISLSVCICPQGDFHFGPAFDMTAFHCRCLFILPIKSCKARSFSFKVSSKYGLDITSKILILANSKEHMTNWCFSVTHLAWVVQNWGGQWVCNCLCGEVWPFAAASWWIFAISVSSGGGW